MPIYQYKCLSCNTVFEEVIFKKNQLVNCLNCQSEAVAKIPSRFNSSAGQKSTLKSCKGKCSQCQGCP